MTVKKGDKVNYHATIGGPVTSTGHVVTEEPWDLEQGFFGRAPRLVTMISNKNSWVAVEALSLARGAR